MKRTNIVIDETLVNQGKKLTGLKTVKDVVNFALKQLVKHQKQKRILKLEGKIDWSGDLATMRSTRGIR